MRKPIVFVGIGVLLGVAMCRFGIPVPELAAEAAASEARLQEAADVSPVKARPRDVYLPNSEDLAPDEMRVIACGTGMPTTRAAQAAACFLVELGNGDKFLFDIGYGSVERLSAMKIPMDYLDKVFIGHLHMDHFGDLDALWIGGVKMNRTFPLRVWGPSGETPEMGTEYAIDGLKRMLNWDVANGLARRAWARNAPAEAAIQRVMDEDGTVRVTMPVHADADVVAAALGAAGL